MSDPMRHPNRPRALLLVLALCAPAFAQEAATPARGGEPEVQRQRSEDDNVKIDELRVRGQVQRIVVQSKIAGTRPYEILPAAGGRDLSQDRRATGKRVWSVLSF